MAVPVVVQGLPTTPELRATVLSACSDALKHRACVAGDELDRTGAAPLVTATIAMPDGEGRHVRIALERLDGMTARGTNRDTRFAEDDPVIERWRTVGLVIAALVGESDAPLEGTAEQGDRSSRNAAPRPDRAAGWVGVTGLAGPGLDDGTVRLGALVQGALTLRSPTFFLSASIGHAVRPVDAQKLDVRWTTLAAGGGARAVVPSVDLGVRVRVEVLLEYLHASTTSGPALSGGGTRVSPGLRGGADAIWPASGPWAVTLGFSVWSLPGGTAIQLDQRKIGSSQWLSYAGLLGGQLSFR